MSHSIYLDRFSQINFEKIIDHPNILIAANFWDKERFLAAKTCYKFMRAIDDMIDDHKAHNNGISAAQQSWFEDQVSQWLEAVKHGDHENDPIRNELIETIEKFRIPYSTLEAFAKAMLYDIDHDGFASIETFIDYSEGASVAPSSIFVHLCGLKRSNGSYTDPLFDATAAAKPCAIFSYLIHIIRDFQKDQFNNLSYFADDLIQKHGLSRKILNNIAHGATIPEGFRDLIREYMDIAEEYRLQTLKVINRITPLLEPRYQLSLHIIYNLYLMVYERIDVENGLFTSKELNPTAQEIKERVYRTIVEFEN